jgi:hypothetical protein
MGNKERGEFSGSAAREGDLYLNSLRIESARWVVQHITIYTTKENQSDGSEPMPGIMHGVLGALTFSPSEPCNIPLTTNRG